MDDDQIADLLIAARLRAPCEARRARCKVEAQPHRWYMDIVHRDESAEEAHRVVSWQTLFERNREAQVAGLSAWLANLHAPARHLSPTELDGGRCRGGCAPIDAGPTPDATGGSGIGLADDGLGRDAGDRVGSSRGD